MNLGIYYIDFQSKVPDAFDVRAISEIMALNNKVFIYCLTNKKQYMPFKKGNVTVYEYCRIMVWPCFKLLYHLFINRNKLELLHLFGGFIPSNVIVAYIMKLKKIPYILSPLGQFAEPLIMKHKIKKSLFISLLIRSLLKHVCVAHALSKYEKECIQKIYCLSDERVYIIPLGIHEEIYNSFNNIVRFKRNKNTFLYIGRPDIWQKGLDLLLLAISKIKDPSFKLIIAGRDWNKQHEVLKRIIIKLSLQNKVELIGEINEDEKERLLRTSQYFFHISRVEGFARSIREAICVNIPILTTQESNTSDIINDYKIGTIVRLDVPDIVQKITYIMQNNKTPINGDKEIAEKLRWQNLRILYERMYNEAANIGYK